MRHIFICGLSSCTIFFPHYLRNGTIFEKMLLNIKCVFWFSLQLLSETFLNLRRTQRDTIKNVNGYGRHVNWTLFLSDFKETLNLLNIFFFRNILKHKISWKPVQYEPICSMRTDGRMDRQIWRSWQSLSASLRKAPNTYVDKAPKVQPTSSESTPCTSKYARCRQPTARIAVSSGPPSHSSHNTKTFQQFILFAISYRVSYRFPCRCSYLSSNVRCFPAVLVTNISPTVTNSPSCINLLAAKILPLKVNSSITMLAVPCSPRTRKHRAIGCISL